MIAVDTSALMAVVGAEARAAECVAVLERESDILISAGTLAEALIVSGQRGVADEMAALLEGLGVRVIDVTPASARRAADAYARWGKGVHKASLNYGDCFAYEVARTHACPLLYIGADFARTDIASAL